MRTRAAWAGAGVLAGLAGLAASSVATAALRQRLTPLDAMREAVIEATPGKLAVTLVETLRSWDKPALLAGVVLVMVVLSALAGLAARRRLVAGQAVFVAMAAVAAVAVLTRAGAGAGELLPVGVGLAGWLAALAVLVAPLRRTAADAVGSDAGAAAGPESARAGDALQGAHPASTVHNPALQRRRAFLVRAGAVAAGSLALAGAGRVVGRRRRTVEAARARLDLPVTAGTVPAGAEVVGEDGVPWRVPNADFYRIDTTVATPVLEADTWRLRIHGEVDRELRLSYDDLLARELTEAWVTLACVSNEVGGDLIGNAWWSGVRIAELLREAGPRPGADAVLQTSYDGWTCGTPLVALTDDRNALLAVAMNGEPLPLEHGYPVRMVVPGLYGFVSATKWLVDLEVTRFGEFDAFWTQRGWAEQAPVRTQSRVDVPRANTRVAAGEVRVGGVAWAMHTGIEAVEVRLDGGPWQPVELGRVPSADTWVQWAGTVEAGPGVHSLAVRATDRTGATQTGVRRDVVPDGATGWHTVEFTAE